MSLEGKTNSTDTELYLWKIPKVYAVIKLLWKIMHWWIVPDKGYGLNKRGEFVLSLSFFNKPP